MPAAIAEPTAPAAVETAPPPPPPYEVPTRLQIQQLADELADNMLREQLGDDYQQSVFDGGRYARKQVSLRGLHEELQEQLVPKGLTDDDKRAVFSVYGESFVIKPETLAAQQNRLPRSMQIPAAGLPLQELCRLLVIADPSSLEPRFYPEYRGGRSCEGLTAFNSIVSAQIEPFKVRAETLQRDELAVATALSFLKHAVSQVTPVVEPLVAQHNQTADAFDQAVREELASRVWADGEQLYYGKLAIEIWQRQLESGTLTRKKDAATEEKDGVAAEEASRMIRQVDTENFDFQFVPIA